jgi:hypothetical protein
MDIYITEFNVHLLGIVDVYSFYLIFVKFNKICRTKPRKHLNTLHIARLEYFQGTTNNFTPYMQYRANPSLVEKGAIGPVHLGLQTRFPNRDQLGGTKGGTL